MTLREGFPRCFSGHLWTAEASAESFSPTATYSDSIPHEKHHRCNLCGKDFETGGELEGHVERRHPKKDVHWWVTAGPPVRRSSPSRSLGLIVAEDPRNLPFEVDD